jgi:hypothetical protein
VNQNNLEEYKALGDDDLVQMNHRLPKLRQTKQTMTERGNCKMTYHVRCIQDYVCQESAKNKHRASNKLTHVVNCLGCMEYEGHAPIGLP